MGLPTISAKVQQWIDLARAILPGVLVTAGVPQDKATSVTELAADAEAALGQGSGSQKLAAVLDGLQKGMHTAGASDATIQHTSDMVTSGLATAITIVNNVHAISQSHAAAAVAAVAAPTQAPAAGV